MQTHLVLKCNKVQPLAVIITARGLTICTMKKVFYLLFITLALSACHDDEGTDEEVNGTIQIEIVPMINGEELVMTDVYEDNQGRDYWYTTLKFYLSNIGIVDASGNETLLSNVSFFDFEPNRVGGAITTTDAVGVNPGTYVAVTYDAGVRQDLNAQDVTTYAEGHPLSVNNNMYWSWYTNYIFTKAEGYVVSDSNIAWFVHTGTEDVYESGLQVSKTFTVTSANNTTVKLKLDLDELLNSPNTLDLVEDGQSHTTDNLELAIEFQENFANAFE